MDVAKNPIYLMYTSELPVEIERVSTTISLEERVQTIATSVENEFQLNPGHNPKNPDHKPKNPDGKIKAWNGNYFNVIQSKKTKGGVISLEVGVTKVSEDLAAAHTYMKRDGNQISNPISSLGGYISLFLRSHDGDLAVVVERRADGAFIAPGKLNATGCAIPIPESDSENPIQSFQKKIAKKYGVEDLEENEILYYGFMFDRLHNISLTLGSAVVDQRRYKGTGNIIVPVTSFADFVDENDGVHGWLPSGFFAVCKSLIDVTARAEHLSNRSQSKKVGQEIMTKGLTSLEKRPLPKTTTLQNLGLDYEV